MLLNVIGKLRNVNECHGEKMEYWCATKENYNVEQLKRDAENLILNTLSKVSSAFFLACQRPIGIFLQS